MESIMSVVAIVISIIALMAEWRSAHNERTSLHDQAYEVFSRMWFDMDQIFIDHPDMYQYFYGNQLDISESDENYPLALCIAEKFMDVFQYTSNWERYINEDDRASYQRYKEMVMSSPIVRKARGLDSEHARSWEKIS